MNFKTAFIAVSALASFALAGCGNACDDLASALESKASECGVEGADTGAAEAECTEEAAKVAECLTPCVEALTCEGLKGEDAENAAAYGECVANCATAATDA
jgi:orotidine-5'-phosphate decarboxylase